MKNSIVVILCFWLAIDLSTQSSPVLQAPKDVQLRRSSPTTIEVSWTAPMFSDIAGYRIYYTTIETEDTERWNSVEIGPFTVIELNYLEPDREYAVKVRAKSLIGQYSNFSETVISRPKERIDEETIPHNAELFLHCGRKYNGKRIKSWKRDGKEIPKNGRYIDLDDNMVLKISNIQESEAGIYSCTLQEIGSGKIYEEKTKVIVQPQTFRSYMYPPNPVVYKAVGKDLVVLCIVLDVDPGFSLASMSWIGPDGRVLQNSPPRIIIEQQQQQDRTMLYLKNLGSTDAGKYTCKMEMKKESASSIHSSIKEIDFELKLYELPISVTSRTAKLLTPSTYNTLKCQGKSDDGSIIAWERDGIDLYNEQILQHSDDFITEWGLHLPNTESESKAGIYICRERNNLTGVITDHSINVTMAVIAEIEVLNTEITARPNSQVLLGCVVKGNPKPDIKWIFIMGEYIEESDKYHITDEGLLINDVQESDSGAYYCILKQYDIHYTEEKMINLIVKHVTNEDIFELQERTLKSLEEIAKSLNTLISMQQQQQQP